MDREAGPGQLVLGSSPLSASQLAALVDGIDCACTLATLHNRRRRRERCDLLKSAVARALGGSRNLALQFSLRRQAIRLRELRRGFRLRVLSFLPSTFLNSASHTSLIAIRCMALLLHKYPWAINTHGRSGFGRRFSSLWLMVRFSRARRCPIESGTRSNVRQATNSCIPCIPKEHSRGLTTKM
jgi:hypothetical protein